MVPSPSILLSFGSTSEVLSDQFGYPGRHVAGAVFNTAELVSVLSEVDTGPISLVGDVVNPSNQSDLRRFFPYLCGQKNFATSSRLRNGT
jgi:hypothetical protein